MSDLCQAEVVPVVLEEHPNADSLSIVTVWDAYIVCARTEDWVGVDKAVYIPPDNVVPDTEEFAFLQGNRRIKTRKFRGVMSQGLLIPVPEGVNAEVGDDLAEHIGITRYVTEQDKALNTKSGAAKAPPNPGPKYDIESWFKYRRFFEDGSPVVITEKLHGTNARYTFQEGNFHCSSRGFYREESDSCLYWKVLKENEWLRDFLINHPGTIVYGEIYGWVQHLKYGKSQGEVDFRVFDVYDPSLGLMSDMQALYGLHWRSYDWLEENFTDDQRVPVLYKGPYSHGIVERHISGETTIQGVNHVREGVVIKPTQEKIYQKNSRLILKAVSPEYLMKAK